MSPFTQLHSTLSHALSNHTYGSGIDRDFSPLLHYIDEFDRHFSHRHRFVSCFIPRFDLEEDDGSYYLFGDLPGVGVEDVSVEVRGERTLVVAGRAGRQQIQTGGGLERQGGEAGGNGEVGDAGYGQVLKHEETGQFPNTQQVQDYPHHLRHTTAPVSNYPDNPSDSNTNPNTNPNINTNTNTNTHRILLSERLTGEFTRTFAFPSAVDEKGVRASMENGVLSLVIPKKMVGEEERKRGVKIPVFKGGWWKAENGLGGENEVRAREGGLNQDSGK